LIKSYQNKWVILRQELTENNLRKIENSVTTLAAPRRGLIIGFLIEVTCLKYLSTLPDQMNLMTTKDSQHLRCMKNKNAWVTLQADSSCVKLQEPTQDNAGIDLNLDCVDGIETSQTTPPDDCDLQKHDTSYVEVFPSVSDSLQWILQGIVSKETDSEPYLAYVPPSLKDADHIQVLVVGSLHLIGCALKVLDPTMNDRDP
jgi:folylpolyglutamate synthase